MSQFSRLPYKYWGGKHKHGWCIGQLIYGRYGNQNRNEIKQLDGWSAPLGENHILGIVYADSLDECREKLKIELL